MTKELYQWVKASERLPEKAGQYLFKTVDGYHADTAYMVIFIEKKHIQEHIKAVQNPAAHEWLELLPSPLQTDAPVLYRHKNTNPHENIYWYTPDFDTWVQLNTGEGSVDVLMKDYMIPVPHTQLISIFKYFASTHAQFTIQQTDARVWVDADDLEDVKDTDRLWVCYKHVELGQVVVKGYKKDYKWKFSSGGNIIYPVTHYKIFEIPAPPSAFLPVQPPTDTTKVFTVEDMEKAVELLQYFVDRVDAGTIKSKTTYGKYKDFLSALKQ